MKQVIIQGTDFREVFRPYFKYHKKILLGDFNANLERVFLN